MLNLLRKLRRKNMNSKYLKYAIGEIILVVIGILIALSINNWNENRKEKIAEYAFMEKLLSDAKTDSVFYNSRKSGMQGSITSYQELLKIYNQEEYDTNEILLDRIFSIYAIQSKLVHNHPNAFENTSNDQLTDILRNYYGTYEFVSVANTLVTEDIKEFARPYSVKRFPKISQNSSRADFIDLMQSTELPGIVNVILGSTVNVNNQVDSMLYVNHQLIKVLEDQLNQE